jgi:hypothetical protein
MIGFRKWIVPASDSLGSSIVVAVWRKISALEPFWQESAQICRGTARADSTRNNCRGSVGVERGKGRELTALMVDNMAAIEKYALRIDRNGSLAH